MNINRFYNNYLGILYDSSMKHPYNLSIFTGKRSFILVAYRYCNLVIIIDQQHALFLKRFTAV